MTNPVVINVADRLRRAAAEARRLGEREAVAEWLDDQAAQAERVGYVRDSSMRIADILLGPDTGDQA